MLHGNDKYKYRWAIAFFVVVALTFINGWFVLNDSKAEVEVLYGTHK